MDKIHKENSTLYTSHLLSFSECAHTHTHTYPASPPRIKLTPLGMNPGGTTLAGEAAASLLLSELPAGPT